MNGVLNAFQFCLPMIRIFPFASLIFNYLTVLASNIICLGIQIQTNYINDLRKTEPEFQHKDSSVFYFKKVSIKYVTFPCRGVHGSVLNGSGRFSTPTAHCGLSFLRSATVRG